MPMYQKFECLEYREPMNIGYRKYIYLSASWLLPFFAHTHKCIRPYFSTDVQSMLKVGCDGPFICIRLSHCYYILYPQQKLTLICPLFPFTVALGVKWKYCFARPFLWFFFPFSFLFSISFFSLLKVLSMFLSHRKRSRTPLHMKLAPGNP